MDALVSAARAGMHAQAIVRRKWQLRQNTKAGDKRGFKGIAPWKEKHFEQLTLRDLKLNRRTELVINNAKRTVDQSPDSFRILDIKAKMGKKGI
ncbi:hypothetical protein [Reinekea sp. G2M2-21]|uniref:hypothetical protein n=1 Tax=Reinekea sp. G2M2-21 TaxID=2788942 RepID=UPI0018A8CE12|nr:hypothetical protein [Reinekea sp. G2M2-21]